MMEIRLKARGLMVPSIRVREGRVSFLTPFLRPLSLREHQQIYKLTGWKCINEPHTLTLTGLFGVAAGPAVYPSAQEMLDKIQKVLGELEKIQKSEPPSRGAAGGESKGSPPRPQIGGR